jgi:DNA topoisomerase II
MVFGHLLTSDKFDDSEKRVVGGRNGYGAKLCNVYSKHFRIECADGKSKKVGNWLMYNQLLDI